MLNKLIKGMSKDSSSSETDSSELTNRLTLKVTQLKLEVAELKLENKEKDEQIIELLTKCKVNYKEEEKEEELEFENDYFEFGKYKGRSFKYVCINYPSYSSWVIKLSEPSEHFRNFIRYFCVWKLKELNDEYN